MLPQSASRFLHRLSAGLCIAALALGGCALEHGGGDEAEIRETFDRYQKALANRDGDTAAELVNAATIATYEDSRKAALVATPDQLRAQPMTARLQVLTLRLLLDAARLADMDGAEIMAWLVAQGWNAGAGRHDDARLGAMRIEGDRAQAEYLIGGKLTPLRWTFTREDGRWRLDLAALMPYASQGLATFTQRTSMTEDDFLMKVLERRGGHPVSEDIWQPLQRPLGP